MDRITEIFIPKWATNLYALLAIVLVPWIIILASFLPDRHLDRNWDPLWVGFDIIMLFTILLTVYFMLSRKIWVIISASALGTLFIVDAWFDVLTARPGREQNQSMAMAVIEIVLSILTFRLVYLIIHQSTERNKIVFTRSKKNKPTLVK
ncbi:MAG TPA: hypothetical protein VL989_01105 [Candidatus Sulfotelmatobacter sp.]|nr:hypothetical protein [Candidatus Sulfotelmatobacter sp.]